MPGRKTKKRPTFVEKPASQLLRVVSPPSVGLVTAAVLVCKPGLLPRLPVGEGAVARALAVVPGRVYAALLGFGLGFGAVRSMHWLRLRALRSLFTYTGWIYNSRSRKTQVWALLVKLLKGPGPYNTMAFQTALPKQPLPELDATLDRYLSVLEPLLTPEELQTAKDVAEQFRRNEGPKLQAYLRKRASEKQNWLSEYWLTAAYLAGRDPIAVYSNFYVCNHIPKWQATDPLSRAAQLIYHTCEYQSMLVQGRLSPILLQDVVPLCMAGYRFLFNSSRLPGEFMDTLTCDPGHTHVIVTRKGHYFRLETYAPDDTGSLRMLGQQELRNQLEAICKVADALQKPLPVAALTAQNRTLWCKQRSQLSVKNANVLQLIESSLFILSLDEHYPKDLHEHAYLMLTGSGDDRWFDKCFNNVVFEDASSGGNVEHSVIDATVMGSLYEYCMVKETYDNGKLITDARFTPRQLDPPIRLQWDLSGMEDAINVAYSNFKQMADNLHMFVVNTEYGREFMKSARTSPDAYIQMALQLTYFRMHKKIVKTYEPSTGRLFILGRTETVHPVSAASTAWVKAMDDPSSSNSARRQLLRAAARHQTDFRLDATLGQGCDRHLLGLYCASRELGMDIPAIFRDRGWQLPYTLSTSQTPTRFYEWGLTLDVDRCGGGFAPSVHEGYGIAYFHVGDDQINFHITSWRSCVDTDSVVFGDVLHKAMADMKSMVSKP